VDELKNTIYGAKAGELFEPSNRLRGDEDTRVCVRAIAEGKTRSYDRQDEERGEARAIGRTFKESLQKCLRSEIGRSGFGRDGKPWRWTEVLYGDRDSLPRDSSVAN